MPTRKRSAHHRKFPIQRYVILIILVFTILFSIIIIQKQTQYTQQAASGLTHFFGGFGAENAITLASSMGISSGLNYGYNPVPGDAQSTAFKAANMTLIDDMPDKYLQQFASDGSMSSLASNMTAHLKAEQNNSQIIAYWILDDWSQNGSAKAALVQITSLIHQYTPGKPSICGFNGDVTPNNGIIWDDGKADNFSPQGCDMVAPYIYGHTADPLDWTMSKVLPAMETSLKARGWNITTNPLVGIPEAFGATQGFVLPTASDVETQTKAFCQAGATGIIFYDFSTGQNISNNSGIQQGVKAGIADCKTIWGSTTGTTTAPISGQTTSQPTPSGVVPTFVCVGGINCAGTPSPTIFAGGSVAPTQPLTSTTPSITTTVPSVTTTISGNPNSPSTIPSGTSPSGIGNLPSTGQGNLIDFIKQLITLLEKLISLLSSYFHLSRSHHH